MRAVRVLVVTLGSLIVAGCATGTTTQLGPYRIGDMTILVVDSPERANDICQGLLPRANFRYRGCWRQQGREHLIVTDRDALTLVHELRHVVEGSYHP